MSRWFRHYAGMMRDDKLVRVSIRSKQTIERVAWVWGAVLESAAEIDDDGRYDVDAAEVAYFLRADESDVDAVLVALADAGRVADNRVVKWGNRQFQSDRSKDRVAAHRERKRSERGGGGGLCEEGNADVTLHDETCNAPEAETDTELDIEDSEANASVSIRQPLTEALSLWNDAAATAGWRQARALTGNRQAQLRNRLREHGFDGWVSALARARASPFLAGADPPAWFTFDFLVKQSNFQKLIEGNYDRRNNTGGPDPTLVALASFGGASAGG